MTLDGTLAVVTGAASGIGRAVARNLAAAGATVSGSVTLDRCILAASLADLPPLTRARRAGDRLRLPGF